MRRFPLVSVAMLALAMLAPSLTVRADEGMWPYNNVPRADIRKKYGVDLSDAWLRNLQLSSVRFNSGGSGSFVSAEGLVLTNHHIASDVLGKISTPQRDYFKTGFLAATRADEVRAPDLELNVLVEIEDVTDRVVAAVKAARPEDAGAARRAVIADIEKESLAKSGLRSDVVTLYRGALFHLYRYKKYTDVRLAFAPEFDVAFFGGDPDNFNYPRYNLDMALFRVYEDGKPLKTEHFLKWSTAGVREGDLVFVSGSPGSTSRLNTMTHLEFLRDVQYPIQLRLLGARQRNLQEYAGRGPEQERQSHDALFGVSNSLKVIQGEMAGLKDPVLMQRKRDREAALRATVNANPEMQKEFGDAWDTVAASRTAFKGYYAEWRLLEPGLPGSSELFGIARALVRLAEENPKPNPARLREYSDAGRASLELSLYSPAPIHTDLEIAELTLFLTFARDELGATNPAVTTLLDGKTPEVRARELVTGTKLADVAVRKALGAGGSEAIAASDDPMIRFARAIDGRARELRKRFEAEVTGVEEGAYGKIARAVYAAEQGKVYPDATFTLRLAFGVVKGYTEPEGTKIRPFTTFGEMYARAASQKNADPYHLPDQWLAKKSAVQLRTPINFVSTSDTIGGNSGSPLVNVRGELVGLNFDRNRHGLVRNFVYDEVRARNIAVDSRGMLHALKALYGADALASELAPGVRAAGK